MPCLNRVRNASALTDRRRLRNIQPSPGSCAAEADRRCRCGQRARAALGREITETAAAEPAAGAQVIDLMEALRASLAKAPAPHGGASSDPKGPQRPLNFRSFKMAVTAGCFSFLRAVIA